MTEVVEVYADEKIVVREDAKAVARAEDAARAAKLIGMPNLAAQDMTRVNVRRALDWCTAQGLEALSVDDRRTWCMFMPTGYYSDWQHAIRDEVGYVRNLNEYQYADGVPMHVRTLMLTLQPIMTALEIRTVETTPVSSDPALFGHIVLPSGERKIYLLARWGESDQNFVRSIEDVKKILKARMGISYHLEQRYPGFSSTETGQLVTWLGLVIVGFALFVSTMVITWLAGYHLDSPALPMSMLALPSVAMLLALATNRMLRSRRRMSLAKNEPHLAKLV